MMLHAFLSGYAPKPGELEKLVASYPNLNDPKYEVTAEDKVKMFMGVGEKPHQLKPLALA